MNESRVKNELLEQALRVIAQENLDLELKKLKESGSGGVIGGKTTRGPATGSRNVSPSPVSNKVSTEEEALDDQDENVGEEESSVINSDLDEFFDIADDPLTDDDFDIGGGGAAATLKQQHSGEDNFDTNSLPLRSCYGSVGEISQPTKSSSKDSKTGVPVILPTGGSIRLPSTSSTRPESIRENNNLTDNIAGGASATAALAGGSFSRESSIRKSKMERNSIVKASNLGLVPASDMANILALARLGNQNVDRDDKGWRLVIIIFSFSLILLQVHFHLRLFLGYSVSQITCVRRMK